MNIQPEIIDSIFNDAYVHADKTRFMQVILNVLSNAIKYNPSGGNVTIHSSQPDKKNLQISITDTGLGFSTEQLKNLYQPYNRLGAEDSDIEGTGIGLALSKKLVEMMGGKIHLETSNELGSTFSIELQQARPQKAVNSRNG